MLKSRPSPTTAPTLLRLLWLLSIAVVLVLNSTAMAIADQDDPDRKRAFQLYKEGKYTEALPLFEKLEKTYPEDPQILETYGFILFGQDAVLRDSAQRKEARRRARELLIRAQKAGADNALLRSMIDAIPVDGGTDITFSKKKEVDDAMREGEAAFLSGDYPKAIEMYQRALLLEPNTYEAALFTGDVYYKAAEQKKAGEWFARAIAIDPNRETAYRYWGDSLMKQGRVTEAGDKFVEAFIAEPYNRLAASGLVQWGNKVNLPLAHPKVEIPTSVTNRQGGGTTINIDPNTLKNDDKGGSGAAWITYSLVRATWSSGEFAKQFPDEKTYRHSLKEEIAAFKAALKVIGEQKNSQALDPSLEIVSKLEKEGLLEAYILLAMPDAGIAKDYPSYRKEHLDNLRRYVMDYVMTGGVGKN